MDISREILQFLHYHPLSSRDEIAGGTAFNGGIKHIESMAIIESLDDCKIKIKE